IVCIAQGRRFAGGMQPVGVNQRMPSSFDNLDVLEANAFQVVGSKLCRILDVRLVFFKRTDTGDAKQVLQLFQEALLVFARKTHRWGSHAADLSFYVGADSRVHTLLRAKYERESINDAGRANLLARAHFGGGRP